MTHIRGERWSTGTEGNGIMICPKGKWIPGRTCACSRMAQAQWAKRRKYFLFLSSLSNRLLPLPLCSLAGRKGDNQAERKDKSSKEHFLFQSFHLRLWSLEALVDKLRRWEKKILIKMFKSFSAPPISTSLDSLKVKVSEKDEESERGRFFSLEYANKPKFLFNPFNSLNFPSHAYLFYYALNNIFFHSFLENIIILVRVILRLQCLSNPGSHILRM